MKAVFLSLLTGSALWLGTSLSRSVFIPGIDSLEEQIYADWESLKTKNSELTYVKDINVVASENGGIANVWANEARLDCLGNSEGIYGAELLLVPTESESGPAAMVQVYIYDLKSGDFIKEFARLYPL